MKKSTAFILMLSMIFSLCVMPVPALAEETVVTTAAPDYADEVKYTDTFENITDNLLYPSSTSPNKGGIKAFSMYTGGYKLTGQVNSQGAYARIGVMKSSDSTNTIQLTELYDNTGAKNVAPYYTLQYWYDQGYDTLVIGSKIPSNTNTDGSYTGTGTYTSDDKTTGYKLTGSPFNNAYLKAVASPTDENNKVLEYDFGTLSSSMTCYTECKSLTFYALMGGNTVYVADKDGVADGRKLAYSWDFYVPNESTSMFYELGRANMGLGGISTAGESTSNTLLQDRTYYSGGKLYYQVTGYDVSDTSRTTSKDYSFEVSIDDWNTITEVVTFSSDPYYPVVSVYLNGELQVECISAKAMGYSSSNGYYPGNVFFRITPHPLNTKAESFKVYVDNVMQYFIKKLTVTGLASSYGGFTSKDSITLNYTTPIDFEALAEAVSLTKGGEATDASVAVAKLDDYNASLTFTGLDFSEATEYELNINEFADKFGQTIEGETVSITTKQAGKVAVSLSDSTINYEPGSHKTFAVTTDVKTDLSNIKFYLKDSTGEVVKEFTPSVDESGTVLTFDLYDAALADETAQYTFVSEGYFTEYDGDSTNSDVISIPVYVISYSFGGTYIINDNLESNATGTNWLLDSVPSGWAIRWMHNDSKKDALCLQLNSDETTYSVQGCTTCNTTNAENYLTDSFVGVVADPKDENNKVVKYQGGKNGDGTHGFRVVKGVSKTIDPAKNIIMSSDILLTESLKNTMRDYNFNDLPVLATRNNYEDRFTYGQFKSTSSGLTLTGEGGFTTTLNTDEWFELKYVIMPKSETVKTDTTVDYGTWTYMVYINDVLVTVGETSEFSGKNTSYTNSGITYNGGFSVLDNTGLKVYGIYFGLYPKANAEVTPTFYVDNLKLYQPDKLTAETTFVQNVATVTFNNVLAKGVVDDIALYSESAVVENAINSVSLSHDGKSLILELNDEVVEESTTYTLSGITDAFGQKATDVSFVSPKSYNVYIDSVSDADISEEGKVKTTIKVVNVKGETVPVAILVAVYGEKNELIGLQTVEFDAMGSEGYNDTVTVDIGTHTSDDIKKVKVHLWNSVAGMTPYQMTETVAF